MRRLIAVAILAELIATCGPQRLHAETAAARYCVLPVKNGEPTDADAAQTWRISSNNFRIPGLPAIVFTPTNRRGWWTIDANRRLVPYVGPYPPLLSR